MATKKPYVPVVGDGVYLYHYSMAKQHGIVRSLHTDTFHAHRQGIPAKDAPIVSVGVTTRNGKSDTWSINDISHETFLEFLIRPTGMGRWKWRGVVPLVLISIALAIASFTTPIDEFGWRVFMRAFIPAAWVLIIYMHWRNYTHRTN